MILLKKKHIFWILLITCISIVTGYIGIYTLAYFSGSLNINSANGFYLYDKDSNLYNGKTEGWVSLKNINKNLINATIAIEDKNFYKHKGFDFLRIGKAVMTNVSKRKKFKEHLQ